MDLVRHTPWLVPLIVGVMLLTSGLKNPRDSVFQDAASQPLNAMNFKKEQRAANTTTSGEEAEPLKNEKGCDGSSTPVDCIIQLRVARAAENQIAISYWALIFAGLAAGGGVVAAHYTRKSARHAEDQALAAQAQARLAENAYANLERPYLIESIGATHVKDPEYGVHSEPYVELHVANYGRSPAVLVQAAAHLVVSAGPPSSSVLGPSHLVHEGRYILLLGDAGKSFQLRPEGRKLAPDDRARIKSGNGRLWIAGEIFYADTQGTLYSTIFEWEYVEARDVFVKRPNPQNESKRDDLMKHHLPRTFIRDDRVLKV